jgi:hypothetical protein
MKDYQICSEIQTKFGVGLISFDVKGHFDFWTNEAFSDKTKRSDRSVSDRSDSDKSVSDK